MTPAGWITIATIGFAALCLTSGWIRPDLTALIVVVILGLTAVITPEQALSGFSAAAVITVLSIFILTAGLEQTGVTRWIGLRMLKLTGSSESKILAALALTSAVLSLFMNTIAAAAVLLPAAMGIARQTGLRPSRLLMPVAFGSLLGGSATLLTTANIIVSTTLAQAGLQPFGLFDFLPIGIPLALTGIGVMLLLAPRLLPARDLPGSMAHMRRLRQELADVYHLREGTSQVHVQRGSAVAGMTLSQAGWGHELGLTVLGIVHDGHLHLAPDRDTEVAEGDIVLGAPQLAHAASMEGIVAVGRICGKPVPPVNFQQVPDCIYCEPQVASVGLSEAKARELGHAVKVGRFSFRASSKASIINSEEGFIKLVCEEKHGEILGAHMTGPGVTELIAEMVLAMRLEVTAEDGLAAQAIIEAAYQSAREHRMIEVARYPGNEA